ncbi:hypothetical protein B0T26DRAFT_685186, partial [Lasiosphaeria miniovina]
RDATSTTTPEAQPFNDFLPPLRLHDGRSPLLLPAPALQLRIVLVASTPLLAANTRPRSVSSIDAQESPVSALPKECLRIRPRPSGSSTSAPDPSSGVPVLPSSPGSAEPSHATASAPAPTPDLLDSQRSGSLADTFESQSSSQESQLPETDEELKQQFAQYVRDEISSIRSEYAPTSAAKEAKATQAKLDMFSIGAMKSYMEKKGVSSAFIAHLRFAYSICIPKI